MKSFLLPISVFLAGTIVLGACGGGVDDTARQATMDAISASVRGTSTAEAGGELNPQAAIETAQAEATASSLSVAATQTALGALSDEAKTATAIALAPILADLPRYGIDPGEGRIGWVHPPVSLEVEGFMQFDYVNYFLATLAGDFAISADITWDAVNSTSSCGFALRADGNEDAMNTYLATITRIASGHFLFLTVAKGEIVTGQDIYAYNRDPAFDWQNEATNRLTVVGRGNRFWIYTNGSLIGEIDPGAPPLTPALPPEPEKPADTSNLEAMANYALKKAEYDAVVEQIQADFRARQQALRNADTTFDRGFMALVALSQSGRNTTCQFDNAWLWLIE